MYTTLKFQQTSADFVPSDLRHDSNGWYIVYYAFNPIIYRMERKRLRLNLLRKRCRSTLEFKIQVSEIMRTIDNQLRNAAYAAPQNMLVDTPMMIPSPHVVPAEAATPAAEDITPAATVAASIANSVKTSRPNMKLAEVTHIFLKDKEKEVRKTTMASYNSICKMLREWVNKYYPAMKISTFNRQLAVEFLDDMSEKNLSARTYNNLLKLGTVFFKWAKEKCYTNETPFDGLKRKRAMEKDRTIIKPEDQQRIDKWFADNRPEMQIVCRLVYTSLLRPIEITRVQVKQLDFLNHCIVMPGEKTKNWEKREGRMDAELEAMLLKHIQGASPEDYLFSVKHLKCGAEAISPKRFSKIWDKMRDALGLPEEYQLYSLKDTAINSMLKAGVDDLSVMQAAGHKDLSMTTIYANHHDDKLIDNLNRRAPKFANVMVIRAPKEDKKHPLTT